MSESERIGGGRHIVAARQPATTRTTAHELSTHDGARVSGILRTVPGATTVMFLMHPRQDFTHHVMVPEFLSRGYAVWTQGARNAGTDLTLLHEQALLDMAAGHVFLRAAGFENVVSVGHSGGATLAAFYLQQAGRPKGERLTTTPAGRPVPLGDAEMPISDGFIALAPHPGQGALLARIIDPSVIDEGDPYSIDPDLDPYARQNGFESPPAPSVYSAEFRDRYVAAQLDRIARIDAIALERAEAASRARARGKGPAGTDRDRRRALADGVIVTYRTDADLRCVDLSIDPNDRPYGSLFGRRPDLTNYGIVGFARTTTPESWLSTWSLNHTRADFLTCAPEVNVPVQLVEFTGDQACFPGDILRFAAALGHEDVSHVRVPGRHFGAPLREGMPTGANLAGIEMTNWAGERFASAGFVSA
jgi:hypothetical protein